MIKNFSVLLAMSKEGEVVSKDVIFEENKCWNWGKSNEEARLDTLKWEDSNIEGNKHH